MVLKAMSEEADEGEGDYADEKAALAADVWDAVQDEDKDAFISALGAYTVHCIEDYMGEGSEELTE